MEVIRRRTKTSKTNLLVLASFVFTAIAQAQPYKIAVVGKTKNDSFYLQSFEGCKTFAKNHHNLSCIYDGPPDYQDPRSQAIVVKDLIEQGGIDGLLISVTDSNHLTEKALKLAKQRQVPVITFDSDLLAKHQSYRLAYIGTNNQDFGKALGNYAKKLVTQDKATICIHSGHHTTPNLNARIEGVRLALTGGRTGKKLIQGANWTEHSRCPLYSMGKRNSAIEQLQFMLSHHPEVINIAVAGFAQFSKDYIREMAPYKTAIASGKALIISADTEQIQLEALKQGLSSVNIGQRPFEMGRLSSQMLYQYLVDGKKPRKTKHYLDFHYCTKDNYHSCTKE